QRVMDLEYQVLADFLVMVEKYIQHNFPHHGRNCRLGQERARRRAVSVLVPERAVVAESVDQPLGPSCARYGVLLPALNLGAQALAELQELLGLGLVVERRWIVPVDGPRTSKVVATIDHGLNLTVQLFIKLFQAFGGAL